MKLYLTLAAMCICFIAATQPEDASRRRNFNHDNEVAIKEFDPVSYFKGGPLKGSSSITYKHKGIEYFFANEANREEFKNSPYKYEPAYGGWCAYTMAINGQRAKMNPTTYKIVDGKLYLFSNFNGNNSLVKWNKDEKKLKAAADKLWAAKMH